MIVALFWLTLIVFLLQAAWSIVIKKRLIGLNLFMLIGVYLPAYLNSLGWSIFTDTILDEKFYLIFTFQNMGLIMYNLMCEDTVPSFRVKVDAKLNRLIVYAINLIYIFLYVIESYLGSGSPVPSLVGIDIHVYSAPMIAFITRSLFAFVALDWIVYAAIRDKLCLVLMVCIISVPVFTRGMRIVSFIALMQLVALFYVFRPSWTIDANLKSRFKATKIHQALIAALAVMAIGFFVFQAAVSTNERMSHYGEYDLQYKNEIGYVGPDSPGDIISIYYGYFPLSFNNLNMSLKQDMVDSNFVGFYSYEFFWFGLLQFDNLFGLDAAAPSSSFARVTSSSSATVATAYWDYWYDYRYLCFIPIWITVLICGLLSKRCNSSRNTFNLICWCLFVPSMFFQSFQNIFFNASLAWTVLLVWLSAALILKNITLERLPSTISRLTDYVPKDCRD